MTAIFRISRPSCTELAQAVPMQRSRTAPRDNAKEPSKDPPPRYLYANTAR
jgi:hypothetical protein